MSVYFIKAQGLIKIGYSANVGKRVNAVIQPFADGGELLASIPGDRALEAYFHRKLAAHHSHGEWFRPCDEIDDLIKTLGTVEQVEPDHIDDRSLVRMYDDKYVEDCADCIQAARRRDAETGNDEFYLAIAEWTGFSVRRLKDIHLGKASTITAGEYTLCRALGEAAGYTPSLIMDGLPKDKLRAASRSLHSDHMGGE